MFSEQFCIQIQLVRVDMFLAALMIVSRVKPLPNMNGNVPSNGISTLKLEFLTFESHGASTKRIALDVLILPKPLLDRARCVVKRRFVTLS
jgi:hypothetical protein